MEVAHVILLSPVVRHRRAPAVLHSDLKGALLRVWMLRGRVALIFGGSALSAHLALAVAKQDAVVVLVSARDAVATDATAMLRAEKRECTYTQVRCRCRICIQETHSNQCDITSESAIRSVVTAVVQKYKRIDIMIHATGAQTPFFLCRQPHACRLLGREMGARASPKGLERRSVSVIPVC